MTSLGIKVQTFSTHWLRPSWRVWPAFRKRAWASLLLRPRVVCPLIDDMTSPSRAPFSAALLPGFTYGKDITRVSWERVHHGALIWNKAIKSRDIGRRFKLSYILSTNLTIYLFIHQFTHLLIIYWCIYSLIYLLFINVFYYFIYLFIYRFTHLLFIYIYIYSLIYLFKTLLERCQDLPPGGKMTKKQNFPFTLIHYQDKRIVEIYLYSLSWENFSPAYLHALIHLHDVVMHFIYTCCIEPMLGIPCTWYVPWEAGNSLVCITFSRINPELD